MREYTSFNSYSRRFFKASKINACKQKSDERKAIIDQN